MDLSDLGVGLKNDSVKSVAQLLQNQLISGFPRETYSCGDTHHILYVSIHNNFYTGVLDGF